MCLVPHGSGMSKSLPYHSLFHWPLALKAVHSNCVIPTGPFPQLKFYRFFFFSKKYSINKTVKTTINLYLMSCCILVGSLCVQNLLYGLHVHLSTYSFSTDDPTFWKMTFATHMIVIRCRYFIMLSKSNLKCTAKFFFKCVYHLIQLMMIWFFSVLKNLVFVLTVISWVEYIFICWLFVFLL